MNESQRRAYLQAMDIQLYFSRIPVAGAKQSPVYAIDTPVAIAAAATAPAARSNSAATRPMRETTHRDKPHPAPAKIAAPAITAPSAAPQSPSAPLPAPVDDLRFHLHYMRISPSLAVIDEVPHQQSQQAPENILLLKAILHALGVDHQQASFKADSLHWPLETGIALTGDPAQAAKQALLGYIAMRQQQDKFAHLVIFGSQVADFFLQDTAAGERDQPINNGVYHITVTHSLQALLSHPILKRETWAHLQALRSRLAVLNN